MIKFICDENISDRLIKELLVLGFECEKFIGYADRQIVEEALLRDGFIVTHDKDFEEMSKSIRPFPNFIRLIPGNYKRSRCKEIAGFINSNLEKINAQKFNIVQISENRMSLFKA